MDKKQKADYLAVARLGAVRGLEGEIKLYSYSGEFSHIEQADELLLGGQEGLKDSRPIRIAQFLQGGWGASVIFEGFDTPEKARTLVGRELFVRREKACPKGPHEYYVADLVGLAATVNGLAVGVITAVLEGGADALLEVKRDSGGSALVPFRKEFVGKIDEEKGELEILNSWILE